MEKLVVLVQSRAALYDSNVKEHSNKDVVDHLWNEVSIEMNATGMSKLLIRLL